MAAPRTEGGAPVDTLRKIAVLRPCALGDFVFALPALRALRHAHPAAEIVLIGAPWQAAFLQGRPGPVDRVVQLPACPGVQDFPGAADGRAGDAPLRAFIERMRSECFDLACQMYGGGRFANPLVARLGARITAGHRTDDAPALDRWVRYSQPANRRLALLEVAALAGAAVCPLGIELAVTAADRAAAAVVPAGSGRPLVLLQPGARDPRRRWPAASFAAVASALVRSGAQVVVNGSPAEAALTAGICAAAPGTVDLAGRLSLGGLCGLLERAALLVGNDTGPLHLALALGRPAVGIFWLTNLIEGMPLCPGLLYAAWATRMTCPVCGKTNLDARCAHDPSFVADVSAERVIDLALQALGQDA